MRHLPLTVVKRRMIHRKLIDRIARTAMLAATVSAFVLLVPTPSVGQVQGTPEPEAAEESRIENEGNNGNSAAPDAEGEAEEETAGAEEKDAEIHDPELDDQTYEGEEGVFVPTEEIPADEAIPFPTDI